MHRICLAEGREKVRCNQITAADQYSYTRNTAGGALSEVVGHRHIAGSGLLICEATYQADNSCCLKMLVRLSHVVAVVARLVSMRIHACTQKLARTSLKIHGNLCHTRNIDVYPHGTSGLGLVLSCARAAADGFGISMSGRGLLGFVVVPSTHVFDDRDSHLHWDRCLSTYIYIYVLLDYPGGWYAVLFVCTM